MIEFIKSDSLLAKNIEKSYTIIKETEKHKYLPSQVVEIMNYKGYEKFTMNEHTKLWKSQNAKNSKFSYGAQVAKTWYWYDSWVNFVEQYCEENKSKFTNEQV